MKLLMRQCHWTTFVPTVALVLGLALGIAFTAQTVRCAPPNIIYIMADDLGWTDTATYGSKYYETPNIDRLHLRG